MGSGTEILLFSSDSRVPHPQHTSLFARAFEVKKNDSSLKKGLRFPLWEILPPCLLVCGNP